MAFEVERTKNLALLEKTLGVPQKSEVFVPPVWKIGLIYTEYGSHHDEPS